MHITQNLFSMSDLYDPGREGLVCPLCTLLPDKLPVFGYFHQLIYPRFKKIRNFSEKWIQ